MCYIANFLQDLTLLLKEIISYDSQLTGCFLLWQAEILHFPLSCNRGIVIWLSSSLWSTDFQVSFNFNVWVLKGSPSFMQPGLWVWGLPLASTAIPHHSVGATYRGRWNQSLCSWHVDPLYLPLNDSREKQTFKKFRPLFSCCYCHYLQKNELVYLINPNWYTEGNFISSVLAVDDDIVKRLMKALHTEMWTGLREAVRD